VALCKFINKLLKSEGKEAVKFTAMAKTSFQGMDNVENFLTGAKLYGLPETDIFNSIDLVEGNKAPMLNVINCLNRLGFKANEKNFEIHYYSVEAPARDSEHWSAT